YLSKYALKSVVQSVNSLLRITSNSLFAARRLDEFYALLLTAPEYFVSSDRLNLSGPYAQSFVGNACGQVPFRRQSLSISHPHKSIGFSRFDDILKYTRQSALH